MCRYIDRHIDREIDRQRERYLETKERGGDVVAVAAADA